MASGKVQTVLGLVEPSSLGLTLPHEHLSLDYKDSFSPPTGKDVSNADLPFAMENLGWIRQFPYSSKVNLNMKPEEKDILQEMQMFKAAGGGTVVENSTIGLHRNMEFIQNLSKETGVNVVAGTGYYMSSFQSPIVGGLSIEQMTARILEDLTEGYQGLSVKCGVIGEVACSDYITETERRSLQATAAAQQATGAPVIIHPGRRIESPAEAIRVLQEAGGDISRTVMSHLDRTLHKDEELLEFAKMGCISEFDLFGIEVSHYQKFDTDMPSDAERIRRIKVLLSEGYEDNVVISQDIHTNHRLVKYGGHGYCHIINSILPKMLARGISQDIIDKITIHTPRRWLTFK